MVPSDHDQVADLDAELDGLTSPTTLEVLAHSQDYDAGIVAASGVRRALGAGGGGTQAVSVVTASLTAAQIAALATPVTVLAAPGAGKAIVPIGGSFQYKPGTVAFASAQTPRIKVNGTVTSITGINFGTLTARTGVAFGAAGNSVLANTALTVDCSINPGGRGPILTSGLSTGGSGYANGDTGTVDTGTSLAAYVVDTVDGGGAVLTYHLSDPGAGYVVAGSVATTVVSGGGDGAFAIDILTVTSQSDGTGLLAVAYYVMTLI